MPKLILNERYINKPLNEYKIHILSKEHWSMCDREGGNNVGKTKVNMN